MIRFNFLASGSDTNCHCLTQETKPSNALRMHRPVNTLLQNGISQIYLINPKTTA